jgi:hypothetical protein
MSDTLIIETKRAWRRRLDHRLDNIERVLFSIQNTVLAIQNPVAYDPRDVEKAKDEAYGSKRFSR